MTEKQISDLVNQAEQVDSAIVAEAAKNVAETARKRQVVAYENAVTQIRQQVISSVNNLRSLRKQEAVARAVVANLASAEAQFHKDGNIDAFAKALHPNSVSNAQYFADNFRNLKNQ